MTRSILRLFAIAVSVAAAIWLVPASVQIASWPAGGPVRIAYLAPLSRLGIALAASALLVGGAAIAQRGSVDRLAYGLTPLTLLLFWAVPYLPWLPDRAPLLLLTAGPLRWAVAAAAGIGVASRFMRQARTAIAIDRRAIFVLSFALYAILGVRFAAQSGFGGDEPHYLIIAQSLLADRDLDIANNHAQRDYRTFFPGDLRPDFLQRGRHGEIYSIHAPGLPAIILPAYALAGGVGAVVLMALLAALTALAIFDLASIVAGTEAAVVAWAAACLTVPFVPHAWLIYPEIPGALIVAWAALRLWQPPVSLARTAVHGVALALLPWLHTKFAVLLALLVVFETMRLWPRVKHIAALIAPIAVSGGLWLLSFYWMYGVLDPEAPYGSYARLFVVARNIPRGTLGLLFDQKFGLLAYSPIYILAIAGAWLIMREPAHRWRAAGLLLTAAAFFVTTTRLYMWWGGSSAPARFLVPIVPLLAPMLAVAAQRLCGTLGRGWVLTTLLVSLTIAAVAIASPGEELLYSRPHGTSSLLLVVQGSAPLTGSIPTFTEENWRAPIAALWPWLLALGVAALLTTASTRRGSIGTPFGAAVLGTASFVVIAAALTRSHPAADRSSVALRGQLALMDQYDPSRLRAVNVTRRSAMTDEETLTFATATVRRSDGADASNPRVLEGPFTLPEGRYVARVWFDGERPPEGDVLVGMSDRVTVARIAGPLTNPTLLPFVITVPAPAFVGVSSDRLAAAVRRVEIIPTAMVPASQRTERTTRIVEPVEGGGPHAYMGYTDEHTYPEGGVFWTRGTDRGGVVIVPGDATMLRLIVHVGPQGAAVAIDVAGKRYDLALQPDETRSIELPIAPVGHRVDLEVRASRAFVPAEVEPGSDDGRSLGCQVRPVLF